MRLHIDRRAASAAKLVNATTEYATTRRYYEIDRALLRLDDNLTIERIVQCTVDAQIGNDTIVAGFTADESRIGTKRTKITVRRILPTKHYQLTLSQVLEKSR